MWVVDSGGTGTTVPLSGPRQTTGSHEPGQQCLLAGPVAWAKCGCVGAAGGGGGSTVAEAGGAVGPPLNPGQAKHEVGKEEPE